MFVLEKTKGSYFRMGVFDFAQVDQPVGTFNNVWIERQNNKKKWVLAKNSLYKTPK